MSNAPSQGYRAAQEKLKTYTPRGRLKAEPKSDGFWVYDYWRDSAMKEWKNFTIGEKLAKHEAIALGAFIHPHNQ